MEIIEIVKELYDKTDRGLDIILDLVPQGRDSVNNPRLKFKLRLDEKTASACLKAPGDDGQCYRIIDYGGGEGERSFSPIDLYMRENNLGREQFTQAVLQLAQQYGITETLSKSENKPEWNDRMAREGEKEGEIVFETRDGFTKEELTAWGPKVTAVHLNELGWKALVYWGKVKDGRVKECRSTDSYPQFIQECPYTDKQGNEKSFSKIYKPKEWLKSFRFFSIGEKPRDYCFGLDALICKFHLLDDKRLSRVAIVSGGSDAVNALSMGLQPVWFNSETADITQEQINTLFQYAVEVYNIPDLDETGIRAGKQLALRFCNIKTVWLPGSVMNRFKDNRGRTLKDLKDYIHVDHSQKSFRKLLGKARSAQFWEWKESSEGYKYIQLSLTGITYFLELQDFRVLKDDHSKDPRFVRINGNIIEEIKYRQICHFLKEWTDNEVQNSTVTDKLLRNADISEKSLSNNLEEISPDFSTGTADAQWFYFKNGAVEVTKDGITKHDYKYIGQCGRYVWKDNIIPHDYRETAPVFTITPCEDGCYEIEIHCTASPMFCFLINASRIYWRKELEEQFADNAEAGAEYQKTHKFCINGEGLTEEEIGEQMQSLVNKIFIIGYVLHQYKVSSRAWAAVLYDSRIADNDECNGRSGKSLLGKLLANYISMVSIDAKNPRVTEKNFLFANVTENTKAIFIDECNKRLDYDFFFARITNGFDIEKKHVDPYTMPFSKSPKLMFATNYVIKANDSSTEDRILPAVFSDYYHKQAKNNDYRENRGVRDDFGYDLADEKYKHWEDDIAFILQCEQWYLSVIEDGKKVMPPMGNIDKRQLKAEMGKPFESWADEYFAEDGGHLDMELLQDPLIKLFEKAPHGYQMDKRTFTKKLKDFCESREYIDCYNPKDVTGLDEDGDRWRKRNGEGERENYVYVRSKAKAAELQQPSQPLQTDMFDLDALYDDKDNDAQPF